MSESVCDSCGARVVPGTQFCTTCGYYLGWNETGPGDGPERQPRRPAPVSEGRASPSETTSPVREPSVTTRPFEPVATADTDRRPRDLPQAPCRRCSTPNSSTRRFCSKCGLFIGQPTAASQYRAFAVPRRRHWWQRWWRPAPGSEEAERAAYRHSLPWWIRLRRVLIAVVVLALVLAYLGFVGRDPVGWSRHVMADLRGTLVPVNGVTSASVNQAEAVPGFPAKDATDGNSATAWATPFTGPTSAPGAGCTTGAASGALLLSAPEQVMLRAIRVQTGLTTPDRTQQWVPTMLDLSFPDNTCQRISLKNVGTPQTVHIHAVKTNAVRVVIVAGDSPRANGAVPLAAITETALLVRPN